MLTRFGILSLACCLLTGCGGESGPVMVTASGIVTFEGKPLANADIAFHPQPKGPVSGCTSDASGAFTMLGAGGKPGAVVGSHKVTVSIPSAETGSSPDGNSTPESAGPAVEIPPAYIDVATTSLEVTISESGNDKIELKLVKQ